MADDPTDLNTLLEDKDPDSQIDPFDDAAQTVATPSDNSLDPFDEAKKTSQSVPTDLFHNQYQRDLQSGIKEQANAGVNNLLSFGKYNPAWNATSGTGKAMADVAGYLRPVGGALQLAGLPVSTALDATVGLPIQYMTGSKLAGQAAELPAAFAGPKMMAKSAETIGDIGSAIGNKLFMPQALPSDVASVVKNADQRFGMATPSTAMTSGTNLLEKVAGKADTAEMTGQANKTATDLMGANDNGEGHAALNQDSWNSAMKNNGAAYDKVHAEIGNVPLTNKPVIDNTIAVMKTPTFKSIGADIAAKSNPDGTIPASAIKELTNSNSVLARLAGNSTDTPSQLAAEKIINELHAARDAAATPEQLAALKATDTKYKTMMALQPLARKTGAGGQVSATAIRDSLNKNFSNINAGPQNAPAQFSNYLNTITPGRGVESSVGQVGSAGNNLVGKLGGAGELLHGDPLSAAMVYGATKYIPKAASAAASKWVNSNWYKNRLLQNAP